MTQSIETPGRVRKGRAVVAGLALAVVAVGFGAQKVEAKFDQERLEQRQDDLFNSPDLIQSYKDDKVPAELAKFAVGEVTIGDGETAYDAVRTYSEGENQQTLQAYVIDQTKGQPGTAVVPLNKVNMTEATLGAVGPGGLPELIPK